MPPTEQGRARIAASDWEGVVLAARSRLVSLWISQVARALADSCLRMVIVLRVSQLVADGDTDWRPATTLFIFFTAPVIILAPVNGALSNSLSKGRTLVGSSTCCLCMTALFGVGIGAAGDLWISAIGLGLVGAGHAVYSSARFAILPAAARDTRWPLNCVMGCMETGNALAIVAGNVLGPALHDLSWLKAVAVVLGLDLLAVVGALPVRFSSDVRRPQPPAQAIVGFFRDTKFLLKDGAARGSLLGLAFFLGVIAAASGAGLDPALNVGLAGGCLLAATQGHPRRMVGLVPWAALGLAAVLIWTAADSSVAWLCLLLLGLMGGLVNVPLRTMVQLATPADMRGNGMALMNAVSSFATVLPALWLFEVRQSQIATPVAYDWFLVILAAVGALVAWRVLLREAIEQVGEILLWPMYRIRAHGPGRFDVPLRGPLLVIANHTAWFDPLWLAKVLPRQLTPMMTSKYFDLPILHWLMRNVAGAIRVPAAAFRREAPELQEAVAVLDRGGCVLIFPEGYMKRRPEQSLRHFGQGVWRILRQRPDTPVVACWIEGGWGSYASYFGGPPAVNKHLDLRRPIEIALETPQPLDPALLADQHATRAYLMRACLDARRHLGLPPLPLQPAATEPAENDDANETEER